MWSVRFRPDHIAQWHDESKLFVRMVRSCKSCLGNDKPEKKRTQTSALIARGGFATRRH